ncbi:MAG: hypothetical protein VXX85_01735 [Candidatus Margulisiibacteriota bacterium]|nr:hypothetical protein [Candidatus Margulisiibacteriota bacterium]
MPSDIDEDITEIALPKDTVFDKVKRVARFWPIFGIGSLLTGVLLIIGFFTKAIVTKVASALGSLIQRIKNRNKNDVNDDGLDSLDVMPEQATLTEQDVINNLKSQSNFAKVIQLKAISTQELESVVSKLKEMVK